MVAVIDVTPVFRRAVTSVRRRTAMSALTPDCDPDLSNCGSAGRSGGGPRVRSTVVLIAVLVAALSLVTGGAAPGVVAFLAGGVALLSALVLATRGVRLVQRGIATVVAQRPWVVHRSQPVG
jgi:hypothetical protein